MLAIIKSLIMIHFNIFQNIDKLRIAGNPIFGLISPQPLIEKYKKLLSTPSNYDKAAKAIQLAYNYIGLETPKLIFQK